MNLSERERRLGLIAILSSCGAFAVGLGLTLPLLSLLLERRGLPGSVNGLNLATAGAAALLVTPLVPFLLRTLGTARYFVIALVLSAATLFALYAISDLWLWFPIRFLFSGALNGLFVASEFWINQLAEEHNRGRYISLYGAAVAGGFGLGPAILWLVGASGVAPFLMGCGLLLLATIPVLIARRAAPQLSEEPGPSVLWALRTAPGILSAALLFGVVDAGLWGLFPVYAVRSGYTEGHAALAITAMSMGSIVLQYPLGRLADRMDRRLLLMACAATGVAGAVLTPFAIGHPVALYPLLFVWGGIVFGIYTIGLTLVGARFKGAALASANACYVMLYALGMLVGPAVEGVALDAWNPTGLMAALAGFCAIYAGILGFRRVRPA
jgi:MFS family permease